MTGVYEYEWLRHTMVRVCVHVGMKVHTDSWRWVIVCSHSRVDIARGFLVPCTYPCCCWCWWCWWWCWWFISPVCAVFFRRIVSSSLTGRRRACCDHHRRRWRRCRRVGAFSPAERLQGWALHAHRDGAVGAGGGLWHKSATIERGALGWVNDTYKTTQQARRCGRAEWTKRP